MRRGHREQPGVGVERATAASEPTLSASASATAAPGSSGRSSAAIRPRGQPAREARSASTIAARPRRPAPLGAGPSSGSTPAAPARAAGRAWRPRARAARPGASAARKGATQAPSQRSHGSTSIAAPPRPRERVDRRHEHRQQQRAGQQRDDPARQDLADRRARRSRGRGAGRPPWSSAVTVRSVARPSAPSRSSSIASTGPSPGRGSSPLPEMRTRVVAVRQQHPLRPDPERERRAGASWPSEPGAAGGARRAPARIDSSTVRCEPDSRAARVVGPRLHRRARCASEPRLDTTSTASTKPGEPSSVDQPLGADLAEVGAIHRGQHQRPA